MSQKGVAVTLFSIEKWYGGFLNERLDFVIKSVALFLVQWLTDHADCKYG